LPVYSPDFNPIEEAFSKMKALLKKAAARRRRREALSEAIGEALLCAVTPQDTRGWVAHCAYGVGDQPS
jgi:transposase